MTKFEKKLKRMFIFGFFTLLCAVNMFERYVISNTNFILLCIIGILCLITPVVCCLLHNYLADKANKEEFTELID